MRRQFSSAARRLLCSVQDLKARGGDAIKFALSPATVEPKRGAKERKRGGATGFLFWCPITQTPRAFVNSCPHARVELDMEDSDFFRDGFIQCKAHGAFFDPLTGICLQGPASARKGNLTKQLGALKELTVEIEDDRVLLVEQAPAASQERSQEEWMQYRAKRQRDLGQALAGRDEDLQRIHEDLHAKALARILKYRQTERKESDSETSH